MAKELQQQGTNGIIAASNNDWQQAWGLIPVKTDSTPAEVLRLNTPQLCLMGKDGNDVMVGVSIFQAQILSLVKYLGAGWEITQIDECGQLAYDECYWLSLAELKQFTTRIKAGKYKSHKNFTPIVFMEFLQDYANEMHEERGNYYRQVDAQKLRAMDSEPQEERTPEQEAKIQAAMQETIGMLKMWQVENEKDDEAAQKEAWEKHQELLRKRARHDEQHKPLTDETPSV